MARALRLPLIVALAANLVVVAVTPVYRTRTASHAPRPVPTPAEFSSLPVSAAARSDAQDKPVAVATAPEPATAADAAATVSKPAGDDQVESTDATPSAPADESDSVAPSTSTDAEAPLGSETLLAVGRTLVLLNDQSGSLGRPVARAARRVTQWLSSVASQTEPAATRESNPTFVAGVAPASPANAADATRAADPRPIVILNAPGGSLPVAFLVDEQVQSLAPGKQLEIHAAEATVRFDRGRSFGGSSRTLTPGVYQFMVTAKGWKLQGPGLPNPPVSPTSPR